MYLLVSREEKCAVGKGTFQPPAVSFLVPTSLAGSLCGLLLALGLGILLWLSLGLVLTLGLGLGLECRTVLRKR